MKIYLRILHPFHIQLVECYTKTTRYSYLTLCNSGHDSSLFLTSLIFLLLTGLCVLFVNECENNLIVFVTISGMHKVSHHYYNFHNDHKIYNNNDSIIILFLLQLAACAYCADRIWGLGRQVGQTFGKLSSLLLISDWHDVYREQTETSWKQIK